MVQEAHRSTGAEVLVQRLRDHGVRHIFGYPGGQITPFYDALYREPAIRHILARDEQAAAFMADGYARAFSEVPSIAWRRKGPIDPLCLVQARRFPLAPHRKISKPWRHSWRAGGNRSCWREVGSLARAPSRGSSNWPSGSVLPFFTHL